jgi:hypothetical protein
LIYRAIAATRRTDTLMRRTCHRAALSMHIHPSIWISFWKNNTFDIR